MERAPDTRTVWHPEHVQYLLVNFIEEKNKKAIKESKVKDKLMWGRVCSKMPVHMSSLSESAIQTKWKVLKKDYMAVTILRNEGGVG
ncbi:hypothetical protein CJ030_MR6G001837 [Morella rubra]|uniref:Myb/SANT-like domain-containing protein n=1 Tax=Morella rubra TaxID=262757 RepID=A0A6A1VAC1_9ROSI|nr:hypothetical protein CJ030_MR6G001837 [Morella rubra]